MGINPGDPIDENDEKLTQYQNIDSVSLSPILKIRSCPLMVEVTVRQNAPIYSANIPLLQVDVSVRSGDGADRSIVHVFTGILHLGPAVVTRTLPWSRGVQPVHHSIISDEHRENLNTATIFKIKEHQPPGERNTKTIVVMIDH